MSYMNSERYSLRQSRGPAGETVIFSSDDLNAVHRRCDIERKRRPSPCKLREYDGTEIIAEFLF